ncbi:MAG: hypothetical protein K8R45_07755, partial [Desulfobacterales bacterium]|nr:hypothetical protein [Desulfobacterales bacterium]
MGKDGKPFDHHKLMEAYKQEFYAKDAKAFPMEDQLFKPHTSRDDMEAPHEIFRALRGAMLRTEVYARDSSEKEPHPYVVTQNRYLITKIQPKGENHHAVYLTTPKESLSYHYERNPDDPRVGHDITLAVDVFGNVTDKISIGYPRRVPNDLTEQGELKILYSKADFINKTDASDFYYIGVPYQSLAFEVTGYEWDWETSQKFPATDFDDIMVNTAHPLEKWERLDDHVGVEKRLVEWTRSYFKNEGNNEEYLEIIDPPGSVEHRLDLGTITRLGLPYETYQAVFTSTEELKNRLEDGDDFRIHFGDTNDDLKQILIDEGGYYTGERGCENYWWIPSGRQSFNKDKFYLPEKNQDPFGEKSFIEYDRYGLLMTKAINPLNNAIEAKNNYRVLQPYSITDPNQNLSMVRFDALGFVVATAVMGKYKNGEWEGDFLERSKCEIQPDQDKPTTELEYDLFQWQKIGKPNYVKIRAREIHKDENTPWQESYLYSDGFGRQVQTKVQAEPGDANKIDSDGYLVTEHAKSRWVGTGRKIYNNKGKPVKQYEPFFSSTHEYEDEALVVETGVTPILFYDSLERVICTIHPNHTYKKVVFDPWKQETWDVNDTVYPLEKFDRVHFDPADPVYPDHTFNPANDADVGYYISVLPEEDYLPTWYNLRMDASKALKTWPDTGRNEEKERNERIRISEKSAAQKAAKHCATPTVAHLDSLGRVFLTIADNGLDKNGNLQLFETRVKLDIEGNNLTITDPRNIIAFQHQFDIAGRKIFVNTVDAGRSMLLADVAGNPIRSQDANGNWTSIKYDALRRPTETIVHRTMPYNDTIASQVMVYGESLVKEIAIKNNQRGQVYAIFDGAGAVFNLSYDFKGNLIRSIRRIAIDYKDDPDWKDIASVDFSVSLAGLERVFALLLQNEVFYTYSFFDALNRVKESMAPDHGAVTASHSYFSDQSQPLPT